MIAIALGLSWQLRRTHEKIAATVGSSVERSRAIVELMPVLGLLDSEWSSAAEEPSFRPSLDAMTRVRSVSVQRFASADLPPSIRRDLLELSATAEEAARSWQSDEAATRHERASLIIRSVQRLRRQVDQERIRNDQGLQLALSDLRRDSDHTSVVTLAIVYLVGVGALLVAQRALSRVIVPIERLSNAVDAVARGETATRIPIAGDREIAHLGERFNEMTAVLASSRSRLEELAHIDELTDLANFRTFRRRIEEEINRASRYENSFGLLVLDLDRFKKYNDTYGHQAGNEALQAVSRALRATIRAVDFPARFGGEEFAVIAPEIDLESLTTLADRVRKAVAALPPPEGRKALTISIGGAMFPIDGGSADELFAAADRRLYAAKGAGRNRCILLDSS